MLNSLLKLLYLCDKNNFHFYQKLPRVRPYQINSLKDDQRTVKVK